MTAAVVVPERRRIALAAVEEARERILRVLDEQRARPRRQSPTETSR